LPTTTPVEEQEQAADPVIPTSESVLSEDITIEQFENLINGDSTIDLGRNDLDEVIDPLSDSFNIQTPTVPVSP
jgi:hypothetical protein